MSLLDRLCDIIKHQPFLSAPQIADKCSVPWERYGDFCGLIVEGVNAGRIEHRVEKSGGCEVPLFKVRG